MSIPSVGAPLPSYSAGKSASNTANAQTSAQNAQNAVTQAAANTASQSQLSPNPRAASGTATGTPAEQNSAEAAAGKASSTQNESRSGSSIPTSANSSVSSAKLDTLSLSTNAWQQLASQTQKGSVGNGTMGRLLPVFTQGASGGSTLGGSAASGNSAGSVSGFTGMGAGAGCASLTGNLVNDQVATTGGQGQGGLGTSGSLGATPNPNSSPTPSGLGNSNGDMSSGSQPSAMAPHATAIAANITAHAKAATGAATNPSTLPTGSGDGKTGATSPGENSVDSDAAATRPATGATVANRPAAGAAALRAADTQSAPNAANITTSNTSAPAAPGTPTAPGHAAMPRPEVAARQTAAQQAASQIEEATTTTSKTATRQGGNQPRTQAASPDASMVLGMPTTFTTPEPTPKPGELGLNITASSDPVVMSQIAAASGFGMKLQQALNLNLGIPGLTPASMVSALGVLILVLVALRVFVNGFGDDYVMLSFAVIIGIILTIGSWVFKPRHR
ncbi:hypothetical protein [Mobiluncus mulieris]|nr:hypothetical protein [Mobiluncus mulieris]